MADLPEGATFYGCTECGAFWHSEFDQYNGCPCGCIDGYSLCREDHTPTLDHVEEALNDARRGSGGQGG